jgi:hypothetical protein
MKTHKSLFCVNVNNTYLDTGAESETIDRVPGLNKYNIRIKKNIYFLSYNLYFSVNQRDVRTLTEAYLESAPAWIMTSGLTIF